MTYYILGAVITAVSFTAGYLNAVWRVQGFILARTL